MRKTTNKMSQPHTLFLYDILKKVCRKKGQYAVYKDGESDHTVAVTAIKEWNETHSNDTFTFTSTHVAGVRRSSFGNFAEDATPKRATNAEIAELRTRLDALEQRFNAMYGPA